MKYGSIISGYQTAAAQQRVTLGSAYAFTPALDISVTASNVQYWPGPALRYLPVLELYSKGSRE